MVGIGRQPPEPGSRRGDIHLVAFPDLGGHVIRGPHPAVVVRTDRMQASTTVVVVPMTSAPRSAALQPRYLVPARAGDTGLDRDGYVKCDQLLTFPSTALGPRIGRLNPATLDAVDASLRFVLDL